MEGSLDTGFCRVCSLWREYADYQICKECIKTTRKGFGHCKCCGIRLNAALSDAYCDFCRDAIVVQHIPAYGGKRDPLRYGDDEASQGQEAVIRQWEDRYDD